MVAGMGTVMPCHCSQQRVSLFSSLSGHAPTYVYPGHTCTPVLLSSAITFAFLSHMTYVYLPCHVSVFGQMACMLLSPDPVIASAMCQCCGQLPDP